MIKLYSILYISEMTELEALKSVFASLSILGWSIIEDLSFIDFLWIVFSYFLKNSPMLLYPRVCSNLLLVFLPKISVLGEGRGSLDVSVLPRTQQQCSFGLGIVLSCTPGVPRPTHLAISQGCLDSLD